MYKRINAKLVLRVADNAVIPDDPRNADYQEFEKWVAAGNTPPPVGPPVKPPNQVKLEADTAAAKQYAKLQALANMSPAEVTAWIEANVKTLTDAKDTLATLAVAVSILARQL